MGIEKFIEKTPAELKGIFNWFLSQKQLTSRSESLDAISVLESLKDHIPTINADISTFPDKILVKVVNYLGEEFEADKVTGTVTHSGKSSKAVSLDFEKIKPSMFVTRGLDAKKPGTYTFSVTIELTNGHKFSETIRAFQKGKIDFGKTTNNKDSVNYEVTVNDKLSKTQIDHAFVEYRHRKNSNAVFYDSTNSFSSGKYYYKQKPIGSEHPSGEYDIYVGLHDSRLSEPVLNKVGSLKNTGGLTGKFRGKHSTKFDYPVKDTITNIFEEEVDNSNIVFMFTFSAAAAVFLLAYIAWSFSSGANLNGMGKVPLFGLLFVLM